MKPEWFDNVKAMVFYNKGYIIFDVHRITKKSIESSLAIYGIVIGANPHGKTYFKVENKSKSLYVNRMNSYPKTVTAKLDCLGKPFVHTLRDALLAYY